MDLQNLLQVISLVTSLLQHSLGRINEEEFMKDFTMISNLKLRLGWGQTGNQGINPYATLPVYSSTQYTYGSTISSGLYILT